MKMKKILVIMGTHPNGLKTFDWSRKDCDIWMFNEAANFKKPNGELLYPRADAIIQVHHEAIWKNPHNRSDPGHYEWLKAGNTPVLYMQQHYPDVPKSVRYPVEKVLELTKNIQVVISGKKKEFKYFSSSPDFAFALVAQMWKEGKKYSKVEVHGIELAMETEYQYQKTGFGFWVGYLAALGIELTLFNSIFDLPMYGYEGDVNLPSTEFERRIAELSTELGQDKEDYTQDAKDFLNGLSELLKKDISQDVEVRLNELMKRSEQAGILNGRIKENQRYLEKAKAMEEVSGTSIFSVGDFDGSRVALNKQYLQVRAETNTVNSQLVPLLQRLLILKKGSHKRQKVIDQFGVQVAAFMNHNTLLFHIVGAIKENQYYIDSVKESYRVSGGKS
jgi:hypothetical protein